jgi:Ca2+-binding RTX toxin-like protein
MRRTTTLTAAGLLGLTLLAPAYSATAAGETCRGEAATIVGTTPTLTGTEGRDVIVTGTAGDVQGLGGDDLICVTGDGNSNLVTVDAGPGNDTVDTSTSPRHFYITTDLGLGADTFAGGAANDTVTTGPEPSDGVDADRDVVHTGDGADRVTTAAPYYETNPDVVDAGPGDDRVELFTWQTAPDGLVTGGAGTDTLETTSSIAYFEMYVDMAAGTIDGISPKEFDGSLQARFSSFEALELGVYDEEVYYRGTTGDDVLELQRLRPGCCEGRHPLLRAETFEGDDQVRVWGELDSGSDIDLGEGRDELVAAAEDGVLGLDLERGELWSGNGGKAAAVGIEDAFVMAPRVTMVGDHQDNRLAANTCRATLRGGHGDDYLTHVSGDPWWEEHEYGCPGRVVAYGGPGKDRIRGGQGKDRLGGQGGNDRLEGRGGNDVLLGGRGRDQADGGKGRDGCTAERERRCER